MVINFELFEENNYQNIFFLKQHYDIFALYLWTLLFKQEYFPYSFHKVALCSFVLLLTIPQKHIKVPSDTLMGSK